MAGEATDLAAEAECSLLELVDAGLPEWVEQGSAEYLTPSEFQGPVAVAEVSRPDVLRVLEPIWSRVPETATRVRGRIETILDFAKARGWRDASNPARWRDLRHDLPAANKPRPERNQAALPWEKAPLSWRPCASSPGRPHARWSCSS